MKKEIFTFEDPVMVARAAAEVFWRMAASEVERKGVFTVVLSGGSTPANLFRLLASGEFSGRVPWDRTHIFWGDERSVPPSSAESNYGNANAALLSRVGVPPGNIHRIMGEYEPGRAAREYEEEIMRCAPLMDRKNGVPAFDLVFLGMGADGHTLSLFPGSAALEEKDRLVVETRAQGPGLPRVTMTARLVNNASTVVFMVVGEEKARLLGEVLKEGAASAYPVQLIAPLNGRVIWLIDRKAARFVR